VGAVETLANDVRGIAVNIAARITQLAGPGQVLVSSTARDILVDSELSLTPVSRQRLRGVPGEWRIYELQSAAPRGGGQQAHTESRGRGPQGEGHLPLLDARRSDSGRSPRRSPCTYRDAR
jgi:hypothetical protein